MRVARGPLLSAVTLDAATGGIAQVSRMIWLAVSNTWGNARLVRLWPDGRTRATVFDKGVFSARLAGEHLLGRASWVLFTHLDLLRALTVVPRGIRQSYAVFLHGIEAWGPLTEADRRLLGSARLRLANSQFTANRVMAVHPEIGPVVACQLGLPPAADHEELHERRAAPRSAMHGNDRDAETLRKVGSAAVIIVGRMLAAERYKGHDQLIDAWPRVLRCMPNAQLVVVGEGDDAPRLRARAVEAGVGANVLFTGFVGGPTLRSLYERCRVFAMPSCGEGFGLVYLEAMAAGLPCIGSRQDAAAEVIVDGETGLLVDRADPIALAGSILRLLSDRDLSAQMGAAGQARVRTSFSFECFANRLVAQLQTTFEGEAASGAPDQEAPA